MFRIFDDDNSGTIDFEEFILALNATKSGNTFIYDDLYLRYCQDDNSGSETAMDLQCFWQVQMLLSSEYLHSNSNKGWWRHYWCPRDSRDGHGAVCDVGDGGEYLIMMMIMMVILMIWNKVTAEEADACTLEILEAIDVDKDGDVTKVRTRGENYLNLMFLTF